jgi:hypothetical protein
MQARELKPPWLQHPLATRGVPWIIGFVNPLG